mgnify:CR=1 FL=1
MLGQLMDKGASVRFARRLTSLSTRDGVETLVFEDGATATAGTVVLNMPRNSLEKLGGDWLPPAAEDAVLEHVQMVNITKVYASYADAWWANHLGLVEGFFNKTNLFKGAPLHGRYHDGPIKCVIGEDDSGAPVYSGDRVRFGNCSGAIEASKADVDQELNVTLQARDDATTRLSRALKRALEKKRKAFDERRTTSHWPANPKLFGKKPRTYGRELPEVTPPPAPELTALGKRLAGF